MLILPKASDIDAEFCRRDFYRFVTEAFPYVLPGEKFIPGWHIEAKCLYLQSLFEGKITKNILVINEPPGHMKSLTVCVFFPAWVWTRNQRMRFISTSHSENFATRDSMLTRDLVQTDWYRTLFHVELREDENQKTRYANTNGGFRHAYGLKGIGGDHADYILADDLLDIEDRYSEAELKFANDVCDTVFPFRIDPHHGKIIHIMQRLNQDDPVGHIKRKGKDAEYLILPAEYEGEVFKSSIGFKDPRKKKGELLWPEMFNAKKLAEFKIDLTETEQAGQLQQRPSPIEGSFWKRSWFEKNRIQNTSILARYISADTAESIKANAAYSAIGVWEVMENYHVFLRYVRRGRWILPELQRNIEDIAQLYKFSLRNIYIESKSSGMAVMQSMNAGSSVIHRLELELGIDPGELLKPVNPTQDKDSRMLLVSNFLEKGVVHLPIPDSTNSEWLPLLEDEVFDVPNSPYRDQADMMSQAVWVLEDYLRVAITGQGATQ
jgi:phage terminase large subunit-like protein